MTTAHAHACPDPLSTGLDNAPEHVVPREELGLRLVYSLVLTLALQVATAALALQVLLSVVMAFATRELPPERLRRFGGVLCGYCHEVLRYIAFLERRPPFPFSDWPSGREARTA